MHVFGDVTDDYKPAINTSFDDFSSWCKAHGISTSQKRWSIRSLTRDGYGSYLNCKGFNARVMTEWLLHKVTQVNCEVDRSQLVEDERAPICESALILNLFWLYFRETPKVQCTMFWNYSILFRLEWEPTKLSTSLPFQGGASAATLDCQSRPRVSWCPAQWSQHAAAEVVFKIRAKGYLGFGDWSLLWHNFSE